MKRPKIFQSIYWKREYAGLRKAKWQMAGFLIAGYFLQNDIQNFGYLRFAIPGSFYAVYYFGVDPAIWGFTVGLFMARAIARARDGGKEYENKHVVEFQRARGVIVGDWREVNLSELRQKEGGGTN